MILNKNNFFSIKNNNVTFIKNFTKLNQVYDFNFISHLLEENNKKVVSKTLEGNLRDVFEIIRVSNDVYELKIFFDFINKLFKYEPHCTDEVDIFFSFVSKIGVSHIDVGDVFIIGLFGKTFYRVYYKKTIKDYEINPGDLIYIPKGIKHKVIGFTPRIIASIGFYGIKKI